MKLAEFRTLQILEERKINACMHSLSKFRQITKIHVKYYWGDYELLFSNSTNKFSLILMINFSIFKIKKNLR